jgi:hypothetical protein
MATPTRVTVATFRTDLAKEAAQCQRVHDVIVPRVRAHAPNPVATGIGLLPFRVSEMSASA